MELPVQVSFRHMEPSDEIERVIREKALGLDSFADHIMSCRVVVQPAGKHHHNGNLYQVRIDITTPGAEIAVTNQRDAHIEHKDLRAAIRDAFAAARRQLSDHVNCRRGYVKSLEQLPHGRVVRLFPEKDYGFLQTSDGRELYFHRNSVLADRFDSLEVGAEVTFAESAGEKGPQASTVKPVGKRQPA